MKVGDTMLCSVGILVMAAICQASNAKPPGNNVYRNQKYMKEGVYRHLSKPGADVDNCDSKFMCHSGGKSEESECIPAFKVCNGVKDCENGADEHDCPPMCGLMGMIHCNNRHSCGRACDGIRDCPNAEDEKNCPTRCGPSEYLCMDNVTCVAIGHLCDGVNHCPMDDDETGCSPSCSCGEGHYLCKDGRTCIPVKEVCDNERHCPGNDDESQCPSGCKCSDEQYQCEGGSKCIDRAKLCDEMTDCPAGDDEGDVICARWWIREGAVPE